MSRVEWTPLVSRIREAKSIVLGTHINADGDGLGCQLALHEILVRQGRRSAIINSEAVPEKYRFLKGSEAVQAYTARDHAEIIRTAALFITLDNSSVERLAKVQADVRASSAFKVCIDHHAMVNPYWDLNCVDTDACASGQLVYELIRQMGGEVTEAMAEALYVSFMTDTGHFRFAKTTSETHRLVAELMDIGRISPQRFYTEVYEKTSPAMATLTGLALNSLRFEHGGRCAWMRLTREEIAACHGEEEDTGDLVNLALAVDGVMAGALFKEMPDGWTKVSLRSRGNIDVNALATHFGGGGHRNASGILMPVALNDAIQAVVGRLRDGLPAAVEAPVAQLGKRP